MRLLLRPLACAALLACLAGAAQAAETGDRHAAWQACLGDAFALRAALSGPGLAADAALKECRPSESAYLAALSASPLLDGEDVARARPMLLARARGWLLSGRTRDL